MMKDLVIIMLLGFCQNVPGIYARKQQSASAKQMGNLLFLPFIMLGTSAATTQLVSKPPQCDPACFSLPITQRLAEAEGGKLTQVLSSTDPETRDYSH